MNRIKQPHKRIKKLKENICFIFINYRALVLNEYYHGNNYELIHYCTLEMNMEYIESENHISGKKSGEKTTIPV